MEKQVNGPTTDLALLEQQAQAAEAAATAAEAKREASKRKELEARLAEAEQRRQQAEAGASTSSSPKTGRAKRATKKVPVKTSSKKRTAKRNAAPKGRPAKKVNAAPQSKTAKVKAVRKPKAAEARPAKAAAKPRAKAATGDANAGRVPRPRGRPKTWQPGKAYNRKTKEHLTAAAESLWRLTPDLSVKVITNEIHAMLMLRAAHENTSYADIARRVGSTRQSTTQYLQNPKRDERFTHFREKAG